MKENLLVLNRNIESEDIDSIALAIKKLSTSSENQFNELKNERWFNRLFNMITFSNKKSQLQILKKIFCNWLSFSVKFIWTKTYRKD